MILRRLRLRPGVLVGQDHGWFRWPGPYDQRTQFNAEHVTPTLWKLTAPGIGVPGNYGNGALYIHDERSTP